MHVEIYPEHVNKRCGTKFSMPVTYYSQLLTVAYGGGPKEAGLNGNIVRAKKLEDIAAKQDARAAPGVSAHPGATNATCAPLALSVRSVVPDRLFAGGGINPSVSQLRQRRIPIPDCLPTEFHSIANIGACETYAPSV